MRDALDVLLDDVPDATTRGTGADADSPDDSEWQRFSPETGTLGVPRASMPQIKSEHRGAMVQFLKGRGITHEQTEIAPDQLKPSQAEYSPEKVERARTFEGPQRSILVSSDDHVIDGHHQWLASLGDAPAEPIPAIRLNAPAHQLLIETARFPSSGVDEASKGDAAAGAASGDELDDLIATVPAASSRTPRATVRVAATSPVSDDYRALSSFAEAHGFTVTSTTKGRHNEGSAHYAGRAVDVRTKDKTPEEVEGFMQNARAAGYVVRDERTRPAGQAVWSAPHVHLERRAPDELDALLDTVPAASAANASPSPSPAPAGDELDRLLADVPEPADATVSTTAPRLSDSETFQAMQGNGSFNAARLFMGSTPALAEAARRSRAFPAETEPAPTSQFNPYDPRQRVARDALTAAENDPSAHTQLTVHLPVEYSKLSEREVGELAVRAYAKSAGYSDEMASAVLAKHPEIGLYEMKDERGQPAAHFYEAASFNPQMRTLKVDTPSKQLADLFKAEYDAQASPASRALDFATSDRTTAGEKALDVVGAGAHALDIVTRPIQAASVGVAGTQRAAGAMLAAPFSSSARDVLRSGAYEPNAQIAAALHKLKTGETPEGYEQPVAEGLDLLSQLYRQEPLNPLVKEAVALGFDPTNYVPLEGANKLGASALSKAGEYAARIAGDLPGASRASALVERASRALADVRDPRVEELFNSGGRVLDIQPMPKDADHFFVTVEAGDGSTVRVDTRTGEFTELKDALHHSNFQPRDATGTFAPGKPEPPPVPERPETVAAQIEAMRAGRRRAVLVTPGEELPTVPDGFAATRSHVGTFIHDPRVVSADEIKDMVGAGTHGELLGHVEPRSAQTTHVVVARDARTGAELQASYVQPENIDAQIAELRRQFPGARIQYGGTGLEKEVIADRLASSPRPAPAVGDRFVPPAARGVTGSVRQTVSDLINLPKSLKSSFALHGPFRQGIPQVLAHPTFLKDALTTQAKAFASEESFQTFARSIMERPDYAVMKEAGLFLPSTRDVEFAGHAPAVMREERFASSAAEKIPGVRASGRAYTAAMDSLRVHAWDTYMADLAHNPNVTRDTYKAVADLINITTGRGTVPILDRSVSGRKLVTLLNNPLWSPRAMASRFNLLSPHRLIANAANAATRPVAWIQLRDGMRAATTLTTTMGLLSLVPGIKVGANPYRPNFGKVSIGNTHYDLVDGIPATAKYAARMARAFYLQESGKRIPNGQSPTDLTKEFLRRRLSPSGAVAVDYATGRTVEGQPFSKSQAARDLLVPFVVEDVEKAYKDAGIKGLPKALPGFFGVPLSTDQRSGGALSPRGVVHPYNNSSVNRRGQSSGAVR